MSWRIYAYERYRPEGKRHIKMNKQCRTLSYLSNQPYTVNMYKNKLRDDAGNPEKTHRHGESAVKQQCSVFYDSVHHLLMFDYHNTSEEHGIKIWHY